jgi:hypothetical protein
MKVKALGIPATLKAIGVAAVLAASKEGLKYWS